jgi:S-adenosylmethionine:tRNA ribosyltransferase-isomerase
VIAVGTTVVRALEGAARSGGLRPGPGTTALVLDERSRRLVVHGLVTGIHAPGESHFRLLSAFAPARALAAASSHAIARGYRPHELGDLALIVPSLAVSVGTGPTRSLRQRTDSRDVFAS